MLSLVVIAHGVVRTAPIPTTLIFHDNLQNVGRYPHSLPPPLRRRGGGLKLVFTLKVEPIVFRSCS